MKKNLRIVSAAAAALLAVAPVAATGVVAPSATAKSSAVHDITLDGVTPSINGEVTISSNLEALTKPATTTVNNATGNVTNRTWDGKLSGTATATINGQNYTLNLPATNNAATIWEGSNVNHLTQVNPTNDVYNLVAGNSYYVLVNGASFNFGTVNANKKNLKISGSNGIMFERTEATQQWKNNITVDTDQNGTITKVNGEDAKTFKMLIPVKATDTASTRSVSFYQRSNGNEVTTGSLELNANSNQQLNVQAVVDAFNAKYAAHQFEGGQSYVSANVTTSVKDVTDQLNKLGMTVDANGYFTANKSFSLNFSAKSNENAYTATLPVTVTVPNGKEAAAAQEVTENKTIMHISTVYDKNGKATNEPALRAYDTYSFVKDPVELKDASGKSLGKFYKLAGKDQYIKVGNIDGTKRTLKHNAYTYKSNGKRNKSIKTIKKGTELTTYGKSFMINGSQMYRVGKNQYIKKANF